MQRRAADDLTRRPICRIRPDLLASKLERISNFEYEDVRIQIADEPRLTEMLWFIQWASMPENYAGGLKRFCDESYPVCGRPDRN